MAPWVAAKAHIIDDSGNKNENRRKVVPGDNEKRIFMAKNDKKAPPLLNSARRLPIVFCLDVSPSMDWEMPGNNTPMELLNEAVKEFISKLKEDPKARTCAEVAFVTFSTKIELDTEFTSVKSLEIPRLKAVEEGGTNISEAVLRSIEKIEERRRSLEDKGIHYYAPFLVLVTDGNPDGDPNEETKEEAMLREKSLEAVKSHCTSSVGASEIIIPFIIGVGDFTVSKTLTSYSAGFVDGYFPIKGSTGAVTRLKFQEVFQMIGNSTKKVIDLNKKSRSNSESIAPIKADMNELMKKLNGE